jgi:hypothetical protein
MGKCGGCSGGKKYKHKPTGKMIKDIKRMAPGKKFVGGMVYPMSATVPYGFWGNAIKGLAKAGTTAANTVAKTVKNTASSISKFAKTPSKNLEAPPKTSTIQKINNLAEKAQPTLNALSTVASIGGSIAGALNGKNDPVQSNATINDTSPVYNTAANPDIGYVKTPTKSGSRKKTVNRNTYNITITNNNQRRGGGRGGRRMMDGRPMARPEYQDQMERPQIAQPPPSYGKYNENAKIYGSMT